VSNESRDRERATSRRPVESWEVPDLERLGVGLRMVRRLTGLSQVDLAIKTQMSPSTVSRIELGIRRTRASTLRRLAESLVNAAPRLGTVDRVAEDLVMLAGDSLAPESPYRERIEWRRAMRAERDQRRREQSRTMADRSRRNFEQKRRESWA
jgi:transcriptional regulator with XRE-family HTH domain